MTFPAQSSTSLNGSSKKKQKKISPSQQYSLLATSVQVYFSIVLIKHKPAVLARRPMLMSVVCAANKGQGSFFCRKKNHLLLREFQLSGKKDFLQHVILWVLIINEFSMVVFTLPWIEIDAVSWMWQAIQWQWETLASPRGLITYSCVWTSSPILLSKQQNRSSVWKIELFRESAYRISYSTEYMSNKSHRKLCMKYCIRKPRDKNPTNTKVITVAPYCWYSGKAYV